jgi:H+-transporting ATPase
LDARVGALSDGDVTALAVGGVLAGLSDDEAARRLASDGPNEVAAVRVPAWRRLVARFWGPLPWMLEATVVLTLVLGKHLEAGVIAALLVVNGLIGFVQQGRAASALAALRSRLSVDCRVFRDGRWRRAPARELVVGDVVRIRVGDIVPADIRLVHGQVSLDQSTLTGESVAVDAGPSAAAFSASTVTRGEATGVVTATGTNSFYGQTSQLIQTAEAPSQTERVVFRVVKALVVMDVALVAALLTFALVVGKPISDVLPFALIILIASVPVALPTTFTVAEAVGALELSKKGVLVTRLSAVQDSASMDVLCTDKTGTLTLNQLSLASLVAYPPVFEGELLSLAAAASDEAGQDPIDLAVLRVSGLSGLSGSSGWERLDFRPFDPATKRTEAVVVGDDGARVHVIKGMPSIVAGLCDNVPASFDADVDRLSSTGARVLAVAAAFGGGGFDARNPSWWPGDADRGAAGAGRSAPSRFAGGGGRTEEPRGAGQDGDRR